jgi:hypothetical protein
MQESLILRFKGIDMYFKNGQGEPGASGAAQSPLQATPLRSFVSWRGLVM